MPARTFQFHTGTTLSHTVTLADGYTQPAAGASGIVEVKNGPTVMFRANKSDGTGTTKDIDGVTLHSNYNSAYFTGVYISTANANIPLSDSGYWTGDFLHPTYTGGSAVSPPAPQSIDVPGHESDNTTVEFVGMWNSHMTFGIQPDNENQYGADAWDGYNFTISGSGRSVTVDGGDFTVRGAGSVVETWVQPLTGQALADMIVILQTGNQFTLTIQAQ